MGEAGVIRFVRMTCFLESGSSFFVRKAITCGTFDPNVCMVRFVGLPCVFTSGGSRATDAAKLGRIRFVKTGIFSGVQQLFFIRRAITSGRFSC
jgi:hypothetical protein